MWKDDKFIINWQVHPRWICLRGFIFSLKISYPPPPFVDHFSPDVMYVNYGKK